MLLILGINELFTKINHKSIMFNLLNIQSLMFENAILGCVYLWIASIQIIIYDWNLHKYMISSAGGPVYVLGYQ